MPMSQNSVSDTEWNYQEADENSHPLIDQDDVILVLKNKNQALLPMKFRDIDKDYFSFFSNADDQLYSARFDIRKQGEEFLNLKLQCDRKEGLTDKNYIPLLYQEHKN